MKPTNLISETLVIVPCYNESKRLELNNFLKATKEGYHFLFVDDGSSDSTLSRLEHLNKVAPNHISILSLEKNQGKAEAVRQGFLNADLNRYKIIGFIDADLSTPINEIERILTPLKGAVLLSIGTRFKHLGVVINRKPHRHYIGRIFATIISNMLHIPIYDSQCGAKFFKSSIVKHLFEKPFKSKWIFDVEILYRILISTPNQKPNRIIREVPLRKWNDVNGSKIRFIDFCRVPLELLTLYTHYNKKLKSSLLDSKKS